MATTVHRDAIVRAAAQLFRRQGYGATGLAAIVAESGAPKGSVYHYFPGGKEDIAAAAVAFAADQVANTLTRLARDTPSSAALIESYAQQLARWMAEAGWTMGCPVATVLLEIAPGAVAVTDKGREGLAKWSAIISQSLCNDGVGEERAQTLASFAIGSIEGALIQSRVQQSMQPLVETGKELARVFRAEIPSARN